MDSFELNKIMGALLFTCLCLLSLNIGGRGRFRTPEGAAKPGLGGGGRRRRPPWRRRGGCRKS